MRTKAARHQGGASSWLGGERGLAIVAVLAVVVSLALIGLINTNRRHASIRHAVALGASSSWRTGKERATASRVVGEEYALHAVCSAREFVTHYALTYRGPTSFSRSDSKNPIFYILPIFPAIGLATYVARPRRITDACFIVAAEASGDQVGPSLREKGMLFPIQADILEMEAEDVQGVKGGDEVEVSPGKTVTIAMTPTKPGTYSFCCGEKVGGKLHRDLGMRGTLIVTK